MALDITGKLIKILPQQSGQGAKGNWVKQEFVIETSDQYPKKICISVWGDKVDNLRNYTVGDDIRVHFNIESREYNERWYTDIRAWKLEPASKQAKGGAPSDDNIPQSFDVSGEEEDLPF